MMGNGLKGLADILAIKRSAGFTPEVIFEEIIALHASYEHANHGSTRTPGIRTDALKN